MTAKATRKKPDAPAPPMEENERPDAGGAKAKRPLERYVQLLEAIATYQDRAGLPDLVHILGLPKTTVYRLLRGLEESELVTAGAGRGSGYVLAPRLLRMLQLADTGATVESYAGVHLQDLSETTGLTSFIAKLQGTRVRSIAMRTPNALSGIYVVPGSEMLPHASASAKAILAFQPEAVVRQAIGGELPKLTRHTVTDPQAIMAEHDAIRRRGYATCESEDVEGIGALACPIALPEIGVLYSVGITGPVETVMGDQCGRLVQLLEAAAGKLAGAIQSGERLERR